MKTIQVSDRVWVLSRILDQAANAAGHVDNFNSSDESIELNIKCWGEWGIREKLETLYQSYIFANRPQQ